MRSVLGMLACLICATAVAPADENLDWLNDYNVVWDSQSASSAESMPCGGGDIGLNVWVENGDVMLYMQRSGSFNENNEYHKLGRMRLKLDPSPFAEGAIFKQELRLREGHIRITGQNGSLKTSLDVWVEVHRPVIHVDIESDRPITVGAAYESWRNHDRELPDGGKQSRFGCFSWDRYPGKVVQYRDVVRHEDNGILFYHRNRDDRLLFDFMVQQQGLDSVKESMVDTMKGRTFGGLMTGPGFVPAGTAEGRYVLTPFKAWKLESQTPAVRHSLCVYTHVAQTETLEQWQSGLQRQARATTPSLDQTREKTSLWWDEFWRRSWLVIDPKNPGSQAWQLGRNYQLFRYQLACNAYGEYPTKFNGGNFTYDPSLVEERRVYTPDWRAWGGGSFTAQNQRLVYWPMLKTGDFEFMKPQFEFYRRALPNATARVKTYWGHEGCLFTEQMENFGLPIACAWGWEHPDAVARKRPRDFEHGVQVNGACIYHYEAQLEFSYMILEYHRFTGADITRYLPFIHGSVRFFDAHYQMRHEKRAGRPLDDDGKLVIYPSTSCESYKGAKNPSDVIAGLQACAHSLLQLDARFMGRQERKYYRGLLDRIPDYGYGDVHGVRIMKPAWSWEKYQNVECPQFYPLFPFNRFALQDADAIELFQRTWEHGTFPKNMVVSWHQDGIFFARMGMTEAAADYNTRKMQDSGRRFPTFWGPGHDWVPDHNWGGSGMIGLQEMLMQTIGGEIRLLPAWPEAWDVDFKLHAPQKTIVEGSIRQGSLAALTVTPESRRDDVVIDGLTRPSVHAVGDRRADAKEASHLD